MARADFAREGAAWPRASFGKKKKARQASAHVERNHGTPDGQNII